MYDLYEHSKCKITIIIWIKTTTLCSFRYYVMVHSMIYVRVGIWSDLNLSKTVTSYPLILQGFWNLTVLAHWSRVTHICIGKPIIIGSDNGLSPDRRQVIIWTNARILLIGPLGTNFNEILTGIQTFSFKKMHLKMALILSRPQCVKPFSEAVLTTTWNPFSSFKQLII